MNAISTWFDKVLVPEWRKALKMLSVWWNIIWAAAVPVWLSLPEDKQGAILSAIGVNPGWLVAAAFVIGILARLKSQGISVSAESDRSDQS
ncbi:MULTISPECIES: hypothetical protein [unclassified Variovorax]|uniref:DUF7940 domain-containing protein n=1 Tax=unclassified Variovorax TaxID=663243 RepID=UPI00076DCB14|nr:MULTISPECIES: hypothetical protein [unclassified Variovorax]KWT89368.1 hypothetical protein APY03_3447 [Variovorax sp. WDL1]PNG56544.1 hypothetical protein CHC07_02963 [Variovorax sp. B4]PNG57968.1 hypothetical protein CHC06_02966 [Variovorax sp. B2]VTV09559.1 hypothetical protein WDL1CHR_00660 [Variovorax sp. WDL1]